MNKLHNSHIYRILNEGSCEKKQVEEIELTDR